MRPHLKSVLCGTHYTSVIREGRVTTNVANACVGSSRSRTCSVFRVDTVQVHARTGAAGGGVRRGMFYVVKLLT